MSKRSIVHIEIPAHKPKEAGQFYADLFGWDIQHMEEMSYSMFESGNVDGGFPNIDDTYKPGDVIVYIGSDDIEADLKKIESMGGKVVMPRTEIPETGWFAFFEDPSGNTLALYTSMNPDS